MFTHSAETVASSSMSLVAILNDILDFSKIEAGKMDFELVPVDLHKLGKDVITLFRLLELLCVTFIRIHEFVIFVQ